MQPAEIDAIFPRIVGQRRAKILLFKSLSSGKIPHAYFFTGPDGVGKKMVASEVARILNCKENGLYSGCGRCSSCKKIAGGNHPDYHVESPVKGVIKIERVRELCKSLSYPPFESAQRVIVIEDVHAMRAEAANSLLKTLEEPPEGNILILTAEMSKNTLPTIRSRCQVIPFFPLTDQETEKILCEQYDVDQQEGMVLARLAEGSPGKALVFRKTQMIDTWKRTIALLDNQQYRHDKYVGNVMKMADEIAELKDDIPAFLGLLKLWLQDTISDISATAGCSDEVYEKMAVVDRAEHYLSRNCNRSLVCENLLFRLQ